MGSRKAVRKCYIEDSSDSENERTNEKVAQDTEENQSSSSESDIENYLQHPDKIDLSSEFFQVKKKDDGSVKFVEAKTPVRRRLSSSDSDELTNTKKICKEHPQKELEAVRTKINFKQIQDYSKKMDAAKKSIEKYNAKRKTLNLDANITDLLAIGESKNVTFENISPNDLHPSDFESSEDEWEEVKGKSNQEDELKTTIPKHAVEITVDAVPQIQKKKQTDVLAAMKRRLNRIRKDNQVLVHKVHLLCWIAHGNYVNTVINNTEVLGMALSMLPSEKCYPADRTDLGYLEQIVQWFKKTVQLKEMDEKIINNINVLQALQIQLQTKKAYNKKYLVYMFVGILRALGIQCRLVLSFQVEPLRPPISELHSLKSPAKHEGNSKCKVSASKKAECEKLPIDSVMKGKSKSNSMKSVTKNINDSPKKNQSNPNIHSKSESTKKCGSKISDPNKISKGSEVLRKHKPSIDEKNSKTTSDRNCQKNKTVSADSAGSTNLKAKKCHNVVRESKHSKSTNSLSDPKSNLKKSLTKKCSNDSGKDSNTLDEVVSIEQNKMSKEKKSHIKSINDTKKGDKKAASTTVLKKSANVAKTKAVSGKEIKAKRTKDKNQNIKVPQLDGMDDSFVELSIHENTRISDIDMFDESNNLHNPFNLIEVTSEESMQTNCDECIIPQLDGLDDKTPPKRITRSKINIKKLKDTQVQIKQPQTKPSSTSNYNSEDEFSQSSSKPHTSPTFRPQVDVKNDIINLIKGRIAEQKQTDRSRIAKKRKPKQDSGSDSDYVLAPVKKKHHDSDSDLDYFVPKTKVKKRIRVKRDESGKMKVVSSSSEDLDESGKKKHKGINLWVEVFLEMEEKWITADIVKGQVHCIDELYKRATHPVTYVVAWNNNNTLKDVTLRYCKNFSTVTRKLRAESKWWEETIQPFKGKQTVRDKEEDDDLNRQQLDQPLPKSIGEYKNHPLYALKRHLLKFEAIYPPDVAPLGFIRGEAVYPKNCVYVCRSRDIWLKEARVVKPGEKPYKIVKARPKWDKLSNSVVTDQMLEIFGIWQTMDYEPPTAENGIVPRNAFGNVELFKPCMLPKKTVHLRLPGLNRICKRMNIDCAAAIVGFDFHCGGSVPSYDGFVVCEEYADQLIAAWELEQEDKEQREKEKVEKRVYGNWKRLIKGLLIRERLNKKYNFDTGKPGTSLKKRTKKGG